MSTFQVEISHDYCVLSNYHIFEAELSLKAKGLLSVMLSLPDEWDYTMHGLAVITEETIDVIRTGVQELVDAGYIVHHRQRSKNGRLAGADYVVYERPRSAMDAGKRKQKGGHKERFTIISNGLLRDKSLSLKTKGLLMIMLSLPDSWHFNIPGLATFCKDGIWAVRSGIGVLEAKGYLERVSAYDEKGRISGKEYRIFEEPAIKTENSDKVQKPVQKKSKETNLKSSSTKPEWKNRTAAGTGTKEDAEKECKSPDVLETVHENKENLDSENTSIKPILENRMMDGPILENRTLLNKDIYNTKLLNNLSIHHTSVVDSKRENTDIEKERENYAELIKDNIAYDALSYDYGKNAVDEIVTIMTDVVCSNKATYAINRGQLPSAVIKSRFLKLSQANIAYVLDSISTVQNTVRNPYGYLLTTIFNSSATAYTEARINFNNGKEGFLHEGSQSFAG